MKIPYIGKFRISQTYKGDTHDGLDLVGVDSKRVYATVSGKVSRAGWENPNDHRQGFGRYVRIDCVVDGQKCCAYYGHLSRIAVQVGDVVQAGDPIGTEGSTGRSTGSHVHYCIRRGGIRGQHIDLPKFAGAANKVGAYDNPYIVRNIKSDTKGDDVQELQVRLEAKGYSVGKAGADGICGKDTVAAIKAYQKAHKLTVDGIAGPKTMASLNN